MTDSEKALGNLPSTNNSSGSSDDEQLRTTDAVGATPIKEHPRKDIATWRWSMTLLVLYLGALLYGLDTTIAADVQGPVFVRFGHIELLPWVGLGFPMGSVAVILLVGRLYGLFDVKWLILTFLALFELGSAVCGAAPNMNALVVGRVIAGIGGAGMYLGALTYISVFIMPKEAPVYNALIGMSWGTGAILGPVIGGAFSQSSATWRWAFYINLPLAAVLLPVYVFINPSHIPRTDLTLNQKIKSLDWLGSILNAGTYVLFMIVLTFSGSQWSWHSGPSIALWVVWGLCTLGFIVQQAFSVLTTPEHRLFPVHFLRSRSMVLLFIATAAAAAANGVTLYYIPLFFQFTKGDDALQAAVRLLPFICVFVFSVMFAGGLLPQVRLYAPWYTVGGALTLAGGALLFVADAETSTSSIYGFEALIGIGLRITFQNAYAITAARVSERDRPNAIGFINVGQIGTIAIALAMAGSLFQNLGFARLKHDLAPYGLPDAAIRSTLAGSESQILRGSNPDIVHTAVWAVASTISRLYGLVIGSGATMLVASVLMRWEKLQMQVVAGG